MSEFNKLTDDAEKYAKDHPDQVHEGEQDAEHAAESKFGIGGGPGGQQGENQPGPGHQQGQDQQGQDQQGQDQQGQDQQGQGQQSGDQDQSQQGQ